MVLVHYDDLLDDLVGQMGKLATNLGMTIDRPELVELSEAATFGRMKASSEILAPDSLGVLKDRAAFFRRGTSGAGAELLTPAELDHYRGRTEGLAPADLVAWLHRRQLT